MIKPEVLAPAGSYEAFQFAINAGADAVYVGGSQFGARAYANNFNEEELIKAINYAHLHNGKLYLTVNTLFKEQELNELYEYLLPYYKEGLDAVIVQDLGVLSFVRNNFPDMAVHCSTQMTITNKYGAKFMALQGATRIVPARELSLFEILDLKKECGLEVEVFVQGALCYCYSGQCLLSSMIGGRSGNRGRCAQPCRLNYDVFYNGKIINTDGQYILSPKDMCTVDMVPNLIEAGVDSFKIEGRMKSKEYVAAAVKLYRDAVDKYFAKENAKLFNQTNKTNLQELYNRGGFNEGYLNQHNGKNMMCMDRPNHNGIFLGKISNIIGNKIQFNTKVDVNKGDVIEVRGKTVVELTSNVEVKAGGKVQLNGKNLKNIFVGTPVYRTRNNKLITEIDENNDNYQKKENINIKLKLYKGSPAIINVSCNGIEGNYVGPEVMVANNRPLFKTDVKNRLKKLGDTMFVADKVIVDMDEDIFLPIKAINDMRREAIALLELKICQQYNRVSKEFTDNANIGNPLDGFNFDTIASQYIQSNFSVLVTNKDLLEIVLDFDEVNNIYIDEAYFETESLYRYIDRIHVAGKKAYIVLPHIFRIKDVDMINELINVISYSDGIVIRNIDELAFVKELNYEGNIVYDSSLYIYNNTAKDFVALAMGKHITTLPVELSNNELKTIVDENSEIVVYGYTKVMVSAQCVNKNTMSCDNIFKNIELVDRMDARFTTQNICKYCYNVMYNSVPTSLIEYKKQIEDMGIRNIRVDFTIEDDKTAMIILKEVIDSFIKNKHIDSKLNNVTRGHFNKTVL